MRQLAWDLDKIWQPNFNARGADRKRIIIMDAPEMENSATFV